MAAAAFQAAVPMHFDLLIPLLRPRGFLCGFEIMQRYRRKPLRRAYDFLTGPKGQKRMNSVPVSILPSEIWKKKSHFAYPRD